MDGAAIRRSLGIPSQCFVVGVFANYKEAKNHTMLLRAFRLVLDASPDVWLLLVGDQVVDSRSKPNSYKAQLDQMVDDLQIRHRCVFLGHHDRTEQLYPACDITVLSSIHEGTPNALLESMACGIPVVATDVCDNSYVVKESETGFLIELGNIEGMAGYIKVLLENETLRRKMGQRARKWILQKFSIKQLVRRTELVYLKALEKKTVRQMRSNIFS
jgi:glycosyltransferase involved in cell wall biosynthesis